MDESTAVAGPPAALTAEGSVPRMGDRVGRYVVGDVLGRGGMGVVVRARDPELDRAVAIKLLRPDASGSSSSGPGSARLLREARALAMLSHPNVIAVYDVGEHDGAVYLAMELVEGSTLRQWLHDEPTRSWSEVAAVLAQAGRGLAAAHAAGIVHRDFKPGNVIVGTDGRVRVLDFGLAAHTEPPSSTGEVAIVGGSSGDDVPARRPAVAVDDARLTITGYVMGTPAYMAPEQHRGAAADQRSDQFSFAVAVFEAMFGRRPYAKTSVEGVDADVRAGRFPPMRSGERASRGLRSALLRALESEPARRFATVEPLVHALASSSRDAATGLRMSLALGAGLVVAGAVALGGRGEDACVLDANARAEALWSSSRRDEVREAFTASGVPYAPQTWERLEPRLDRRVDAWRSARTESCNATSDAERLLACLDRRAHELTSVLDVLAEPDYETVARSGAIVAALPSIESCAEPSTHLIDTGNEEVMRVEDQLQQASILSAAGRWPEALDIASAACEEADALDVAALRAHARFRLGRIEMKVDKLQEARDDLALAYHLATSARYDELAADAAIELIEVVGWHLQKREEADEWVMHARAAVKRLGSDAQPRSALLMNEGMLAARDGDSARALELFEEALAIRQRILPATHPDVARAVQNIAAAHIQLGQFDRAQPLLERTIDLYVQMYGEDHPDVGTALANTGASYFEQRKLADARRYHERALAVRERVLPENHLDLASSLVNIAGVVGEQGDFLSARAYYERAQAMRAAALSPEHPDVVGIWSDIGITYSREGRYEEAREAMDRALEGQLAALGPDHPDVAKTWANLGVVAQYQEDFVRSEQAYRAAIAIFERRFGPDHAYVAMIGNNLAAVLLRAGKPAEALPMYERMRAIHQRGSTGENSVLSLILTGIGRAHLDLGNLDTAITTLEEGLAMAERTQLEPRLLVEARFALALACWERPAERTRALGLARTAKSEAEALGPGEAGLRREIADWLDTRT